jgi:hypothetical protein
MQLPLSQTKGQSWPLVQLPPLSHVCGVRFVHRLACGRHTPPHMPMLPDVMHTFGHAWLLTHVPDALQSCWLKPMQRVVPGVHVPLHAFGIAVALHTEGHGAVVQLPCALQVWRLLPMQRV